MLDVKECYRVLEQPLGAAPSEVRQAYKRLVRIWHPDRYADDPRQQRIANEKFRTINEAYRVLSKLTKRREAASAESVVDDLRDVFGGTRDSHARGSSSGFAFYQNVEDAVQSGVPGGRDRQAYPGINGKRVRISAEIPG